MPTRNLILAAAITLAPPFVNAHAGDLPSLDELLKQYKELGLPLPPKDAKLVEFESKDQDSTKHFAAIEIKPSTWWRGPILLSYDQEGPNEWAENVRPLKATPDAFKQIDLSNESALLLAIQSHSLGWQKLSKHLYDASRKGAKKSPRSQLMDVAWWHWYEIAFRPRTDRTPAARHMKQILQQDKEFDTKEYQALVRSLELAVVPSKAKPGSIEWMIDDLVNLNDEDTSEDLYRPEERIMRIVRLGFDAIPALIEHIGDDRLTRHVAMSITGSPKIYYWRVGDVVEGLISEIAGRPANEQWTDRRDQAPIDKRKVQKWLQEARKIGEEQYLVSNCLHPYPDEPGRASINIDQIVIIDAKYPNQLIPIYRKLLDKYPKTRQHGLTRLIVENKNLPEKERYDIVVRATKHTNKWQRYIALEALCWDSEKNKRFEPLLIAALEDLPRTVVPDDRDSRDDTPEINVVRLAARSSSPTIWAKLQEVASRSSVDFRMEILAQLRWADDPARARLSLRLLAAFLGDSALRKLKPDAPKPDAAPDYPKLAVRDFAAMAIADMLEIKVETNPKRTPDEWAKLRAKVREELNRAEKK